MLQLMLKKIVQILPKIVLSGDSKPLSERHLFEDNSYRAIRKAQLRLWTSIGAVVFIVVAVCLFLIFTQMSTAKKEKISSEYSKIANIYSQELADYSQKNNDASKSLSTPDHAQSAALFVKFAEANKENAYGWQAALQSAAYFIETNKFAEAKNVLEPILPYVQTSTLMQIKVKTTLATLYSIEKNYDKAIAELTFVENLKKNPFSEQASFLKGKILFIADKKADAQKVFNDLIARGGSDKSVSVERDKLIQQAKIWLSYISA